MIRTIALCTSAALALGGISILPVQAVTSSPVRAAAVTHYRSYAPATPGGRPWQAPWGARFHITASCNNWVAKIRAGAAAWTGLQETGDGISVQCQSGFITGEGAGAIGHNYGTRIVLAPGKTANPGLLAAHEFGHIWYFHTYPPACNGWASPADVMRTPACS